MATKSQPAKPWERQPKESAKAFEAFDTYCRQGASRSIRKVARQLGKSATLMSRWSSRWDWPERSRAYDNEIKRQEIEEQQEAFRKMNERQIKTAVMLQAKAIEALKDMDLELLNPSVLLRFITEGARMEREIRMDTAGKAEGDGSDVSLGDSILAAYRKRLESGES